MKNPTIYEQSELGLLPADWRVASLRELGQPKIGLTYRPSDVREHGTLVLRSSNVQDGRLCFEDNVFVDPEVAASAHVEHGDILICVRNGSRALIGKCAQIDEQAAGMAFGAFMSVYRSEHSDFVFRQFQSDGMKRQIEKHLGATINQITNASLNSFKIPFTDSPEERDAIVETLKDIDDLIVSLDALIAKKRDIKQAAMQQLLTGKTRLPGFEGEWKSCPLGDVLRVRHGRDQKAIQRANGHFPILATGGEIGRTDTALYSNPSVLIGRKGTIDRPQYMDQPFWTVDTLFYTEIQGNNSPLFLFYVFETIDWRSFNESSGVPSLSSKTIESIVVHLPEPKEQAAIAESLADFDREIEVLKQRAAKSRSLKDGMMQQLLTGRIRLV